MPTQLSPIISVYLINAHRCVSTAGSSSVVFTAFFCASYKANRVGVKAALSLKDT